VVFDDYCDWYLELLKRGQASPVVAGHVLEQLLALAHPVMPFITEESWARLEGAEGLMLTHAPPAAPGPRDPDATAAFAAVRDEVGRARAERSARGLRPRAELLVRLPAGWAQEAIDAFVALAGPVALGEPVEGPAAELAAAAPAPDAERRLLREELAHAKRELDRARARLDDGRFVERAPAALVEAERGKAERWSAERDVLAARLAELDGAR
jgi:valyl-tRNA synthetase